MPSLAALVFLAAVCMAAGLAALWFLVKQRRWWPACFMTAAYGAILYVIYATLLVTVVASSSTPPLLSLATVTCAYALLLTIASVSTQNPSVKERATLGAGVGALALLFLFIASASVAHFQHQAFVAFGAALTGGVLLASTVVSNILFPRRPAGARMRSHVLYYGSILSMLVQAVSCQTEGDALAALLVSVIFTSAGTAGVVYEADAAPPPPRLGRL